MSNLLIRLWNDRSGATAIEYGLIGTLIAVVIMGSVAKVGNALTYLFDTMAATALNNGTLGH
jgi:pilus assembly protein Flp/PilA